MQVSAEFSVNTIVVISTLSEEEAGSSKRLIEDLEVLSKIEPKFGLLNVVVCDIAHLRRVLLDIRNLCRKGMRPIIHIDGHGCRKLGLEISRSPEIGGSDRYMSWDELVKSLRKVNRATGNNLCVVIAACEAAHIIRPISFFKQTPFYVLLAPQEKVSVGYLEGCVMPFYEELLTSGSVDQAHKKLSEEFIYFHAEKILVISLARYVRRHCVGKGKELRRERLLTEAFAQGIPNTLDNRKFLRKHLRSNLRPSNALIEKYGARFLFDRKCSISMEDILLELGFPPSSLIGSDQISQQVR